VHLKVYLGVLSHESVGTKSIKKDLHVRSKDERKSHGFGPT